MAIQFRDPFQYRLAMLESSMDPNAANPASSARGLFQWMPDTAAQYGATPGDPESEMTAEEKFRADNLKTLYSNLQRDPTPGELYLAHQQGAAGASKLLANPDTPAVDLVGQDEVVKNGGTPDMNGRQFADLWVKKFEDGYTDDPSKTGMSVRMPDGTIINNVPPGTSKADIKAKLEAAGAWKPEWDAVMGASDEGAKPEEKPAGEAAVAPTPATAAPATTNPPGAGPDNTPAMVAAAQKRMDDIVKNGYKGEPSKAMGALSKFAQGATFGFGDEIAGGMAAIPISLGTGMSLPESYNKATESIRRNMQKVEKENPKSGFALELGGALASGKAIKDLGMGALNLAAKGEQALTGTQILPQVGNALARWAVANPVKAGGLIAGGTGALYGLGTGEGDLGDRAGNAATSGLISVPFGMAGGALAKFLNARGVGTGASAAPAASPADDLAAAAGMQADDAAAPAGRSALARLASPKGATLEEAIPALTPEQAERAQVLKAVGIEKPTAAMISRDPRQWQFEKNTSKIAGAGDELMQRYTDSNIAIQEALDKLGKSTGGKASTPYEAGESVVDAVNSKSREMQAEVGKLYSKVRDEFGGNMGLAPNRVLGAIDEASDNAYADNIVNSMLRKMRRYGVVDGEGKAVEGATLNVNQAEELRKFANSLKGDHQTDRIVNNIIDSLDDDVIETAGTDAFKTARDAARDRFAEFQSKILGGVTEGKVVADDVLRKTVFGGKVKDVQALKDSLLSGTENQIARGTQAWNDLKLQAIQTLTNNATDSGGALSGARLTKEMDKIGKERLETLFDPEELLKLKTIQKAAEYTTVQVPGSAVNHSNTASALASILESSNIGSLLSNGGLLMTRIPAVGKFTAPVAAAVKASGNVLKDAAQQSNIQRAVNPFGSALSRYTNPTSLLMGGFGGGALGQQFAPRDENP